MELRYMVAVKYQIWMKFKWYKKNLKMVLKLDRLMPTNDLHENIKTLKIDDIYQCKKLGIVNEMVSKQSPAIFRNYFKKHTCLVIYKQI